SDPPTLWHYPAPVPVSGVSRAFSPRAYRRFRTVVRDRAGAGPAASTIITDAPGAIAAVSDPAADRTRAGTRRAPDRRVPVLAGLALLPLLAAIGVLLAPVVADDPVVNWPRAGQLPSSTVLPLVPYRPLSLDARVPCAALAALDLRPEGGDA